MALWKSVRNMLLFIPIVYHVVQFHSKNLEVRAVEELILIIKTVDINDS